MKSLKQQRIDIIVSMFNAKNCQSHDKENVFWLLNSHIDDKILELDMCSFENKELEYQSIGWYIQKADEAIKLRNARIEAITDLFNEDEGLNFLVELVFDELVISRDSLSLCKPESEFIGCNFPKTSEYWWIQRADKWLSEYKSVIVEFPEDSRIINMNRAVSMTETKPHNHYFKDVSKLETIDVYRVLDLFKVTDPAIAHAAKKLLVAGGRGAGKDIHKDIQEAIDSLKRWQNMQMENAN